MAMEKSELVDYHLRLAALSVRDASSRMAKDAEGKRLARAAEEAVEAVRTHVASRAERG